MEELIYRKGNDWVDLNNLPVKKYKSDGTPVKKITFNWKDCNGQETPFYIKGVQGAFKTYFSKHDNKKGYYLILVYDNKEFEVHASSLYFLKLSSIVSYKDRDFKFNVGDTINNGTIVERFRTYYGGKRYKLICHKYQEYYYSNENDLRRHRGSPYVTGDKVCYANSLYSVKKVHKYVKNIEDSKNYTKGSNKSILCKCPSCGEEKYIKVYRLCDRGFSCSTCRSNISYPERLMLSLLDDNDIKYEYQKKFNFLPNRIYDFYLPDYNLVIETHGEQHYKVSEKSKWSLYKEVDKEKEQYLQDNNINLCIIDCCKSDFNYILNNIRESILINYISTVNEEKLKLSIEELYLSDDKKYVIQEYLKGKSVLQMSKELGIKHGTLYNWIHKAGVFKDNIH
jgi:transposase-like protein